uniref:Phosphoinositide-interacting protein n=1 Tax=Panagrolaimus sp. PS1159 TaxID=55785 RepID=A0AC35FIB9_9BILA
MNSSIYRSYGESSNSNVLRYGDDEITPYPFAEQLPRPSTLPILRIETAPDVTYRPESATVSTSPQNKLYIGQKEYTESLRRRNMTMFKENIQCKTRQKNGPSSPTTVLTMAGLFVCGSFLLLSGLIVLIVHNEIPYIVTGSIFTGVGTFMVIICGFLQRKNVLKYFYNINRDLYKEKSDT